MNQYSEALRVARRTLATGKTGSELSKVLDSVMSSLVPEDKKRLAQRLKSEYMILGHSAHDPNIYKTCQEAKKAKESSLDPHLKILTYKTPMCSSCSLNRMGSCSLMGGRIIEGPQDIPEKAVHKTADLLIANSMVNEKNARSIEMSRLNSSRRIAKLHQRKVSDSSVNPSSHQDISAQMQSRRVASILEPGESFDAKPKKSTGPASQRNAELIGVGNSGGKEDSRVERVASGMATYFDNDMQIDLPMDLPKGRSSGIQIDAYTQLAIPASERRVAREHNHDILDGANVEIQSDFLKVSKLASNLFKTGSMTTRRASRIFSTMSELISNGARHTTGTERLYKQLDLIGGGFEL